MSKTKTITPRMVEDWLKTEACSYRILADVANGKLKPSTLKEDIAIHTDNERSSQ